MKTFIDAPSLNLFVAPPKSGKTYLIKFLIKTLQSKFDYGLILCPTAFTGSYDWIENKDFIHQIYKPELIANMMEIQKQNPKARAFLILDDCIGAAKWNSDIISQLITTYRHYRISIFIATQYVNRITPKIRACVNNAFIFMTDQQRSLQALWESYFTSLKNWREVLELLKTKLVDLKSHKFILVRPGEDTVILGKAGKVPEKWKFNVKE